MNRAYEMQKTELLAPAGDMESLRAALQFGADAVYVGGPMLQLRAGETGFSLEALAKAAVEAHARGRKIYVAVNAFPNNRELDALADYAQSLHGIGIDAVIAADLGAIRTIRRAVPELQVHVSTQANCINWASAMTYYDLGCTRVVLGREMTLEDIRELRARVPQTLELEAFVHGAMCMAYSGRCLLSAYLTGRSANRGACAQSCRWRYALMEETREGQFFPIEEDTGGTTILSSYDLDCLDFLDQIMDAGVCAFKLEGRMKSAFYVATVVNAYRRRIDGILAGTPSEDLLPALRCELESTSHRASASGFYFGAMKKHAPDDGTYHQTCRFVGTVVERLRDGRIRVELRNRVCHGDRLEVLSPSTIGVNFRAAHMTDASGLPIQAATVPMMCYDMEAPEAVRPGDLLRVRLAEIGV